MVDSLDTGRKKILLTIFSRTHVKAANRRQICKTTKGEPCIEIYIIEISDPFLSRIYDMCCDVRKVLNV